MKIDFSQPILDLENAETGLTLGTAAIQAMMTPTREDENMQASEKLRLYELSLKIKANGNVDMVVEDVAFIRARIGKVFSPLVVGRAFAMLG
ncbi:hypothetical protein NKJ52_20620 [Mesorhizobium australicum]|uniref:hypothetical protein n=1 Tax=Mesorhizobium australicum TaxID=536018 RepID=UPI00333BC0E2